MMAGGIGWGSERTSEARHLVLELEEGHVAPRVGDGRVVGDGELRATTKVPDVAIDGVVAHVQRATIEPTPRGRGLDGERGIGARQGRGPWSVPMQVGSLLGPEVGRFLGRMAIVHVVGVRHRGRS